MKNKSMAVNTQDYFSINHLKNDLKKRSIRGGVVTLTTQACKFILQFCSAVLLARLLTPQDYGIVGMVTAITGFVGLFQEAGLSAATIQKDQVNHQQVSTLFWINFCISLGLMMLTCLFAPLIAKFYGEARLTWITLALASNYIFIGLAVQHKALLNRQMCFSSLAAIDITAMFVGVASAIVSAACGMGYWALVLLQVTTNITSVMGIWIACKWRPGPPVRHSQIGSMLVFGGNLTGFNAVNYLSRNLDNLLIGKYWGAGQLGLYAKAYQLFTMPLQQINAPVTAVAVPTLSRLLDSPDQYKRVYLRMIEKVCLLSMPLIIFTICSADWIILFFLGPQWSEASRIFIWLGIIAIVQPISNTTGWLFVTQNRTKEQLKWGLISGALTILSFLTGLPWGATGVAAAYATSGLLIRTPLLFWFVGKVGPVRTKDIYYALSPFLLTSLGTIAVLLFTRNHLSFPEAWINIMIMLTLTIVTTVLLLLAFPSGRSSIHHLKTSLAYFSNN
jgi:O-antigen/teichoic acid export membrane protein